MSCKFLAYAHRLVYATDHAMDKDYFKRPMRLKLPKSIYDYPLRIDLQMLVQRQIPVSLNAELAEASK
jgi:hypothetical protein